MALFMLGDMAFSSSFGKKPKTHQFFYREYIGENILRERTKKKITAAELSKYINRCKSYIHEIEKKRSCPDEFTVCIIASKLEVDASELMKPPTPNQQKRSENQT